jgi:hypothetical protein
MLSSGQASVITPSGIDRYDLGHLDGVPLCFTDAAALPDGGMVFSAVAEDPPIPTTTDAARAQRSE